MNPALLHKQLQNNASDLQDFYKDLKVWGDEMRRKEGALTKSEKSLKKPNASTEKISDNKKKAKTANIIGGPTDYAKWEKFDADIACEHLEDDVKDDSELSDEFDNNALQEASKHKEKGNNHVKKHEWTEAIDCYTKAIQRYSYDPVFYANRALCYLKMDNFSGAEDDCTKALKLNNNYVKALMRRAVAREHKNKLELARLDLEMALSFEPKNQECKLGVERLRKKMKSMEKPQDDSQRPVSKFTAARNHLAEKPTVQYSAETVRIDSGIPWPDPGCEIINVKAINKPPHLRSKKPLSRVKVVEVNSALKSDDEPQAIKKTVFERVAPQTNRKETPNEEVVTTRPNIISEDVKLIDKAPETTRKDVIEKPKTANIKCEEVRAPVAVKTHVVQRLAPQKTVLENKSIGEADNGLLPAPKTSVQFYSAWKTLKSLKEKYTYLKQIEPSEMAKIFQNSLESDIFSEILEIFATCFVEHNDEVHKYLQELTRVKRFSTLVLFMEPEDKKRLWKIIGYLQENSNIPKELVDKLLSDYDL